MKIYPYILMKNRWWYSITILFFIFTIFNNSLFGQDLTIQRYDIGNPSLTDIFVDPVNGNDNNNGNSRASAVQTVREAWNRIPSNQPLTTGYRINLLSGTYPASSLPNYLEYRRGTFQYPIIIQSADGLGGAKLFGGSFNIFATSYMYLIDLDLINDSSGFGGGDVIHFESCDHILIRNCRVDGGRRMAHETIKVNQSKFIYIEDSDIHGAEDNAIDFVSVQYGHIKYNRIHDSQDWCAYTKGGSAYLVIEGNEFFDAGGGFTAGQGTGFQYMSFPWLHYEAYDIKIINNIVHDVDGAGFGVQGGYNILIAYNTLYRIGRSSHALEFGFGSRSCDGQPGDAGRDSCSKHLSEGGWGTTVVDDGSNFARIPNKNVYVFNNIFYNPVGYQSTWQQFQIFGAYSGDTQTGSNIPSPALADDDLRIRGNIIWNGPSDHPLGLGTDSGCQPTNTNCNETQLRTDNYINTLEPQLVNPASGNYHPVKNGNVFSSNTFPVPSFAGNDRPLPPLSIAGNYTNTINRDREGALRSNSNPPGVYINSTSTSIELISHHKTITLHQNYPNPFGASRGSSRSTKGFSSSGNSTTTLEYEIDRPAFIDLTVYNEYGQQIAILKRQNHDVGMYRTQFNAAGLSSGNYIAVMKLVSNGEIHIQHVWMTLVK